MQRIQQSGTLIGEGLHVHFQKAFGGEVDAANRLTRNLYLRKHQFGFQPLHSDADAPLPSPGATLEATRSESFAFELVRPCAQEVSGEGYLSAVQKTSRLLEVRGVLSSIAARPPPLVSTLFFPAVQQGGVYL